jgi:hypothetical protein
MSFVSGVSAVSLVSDFPLRNSAKPLQTLALKSFKIVLKRYDCKY